jgi:hypothetical protein
MLYHDKVCAGNASPLHGFADGLIQAAHVWVTIVFEINGCATSVGSRPALSFRDGLAVTFLPAPPGMNANSSFAVGLESRRHNAGATELEQAAEAVLVGPPADAGPLAGRNLSESSVIATGRRRGARFSL